MNSTKSLKNVYVTKAVLCFFVFFLLSDFSYAILTLYRNILFPTASGAFLSVPSQYLWYDTTYSTGKNVRLVTLCMINLLPAVDSWIRYNP